MLVQVALQQCGVRRNGVADAGDGEAPGIVSSIKTLTILKALMEKPRPPCGGRGCSFSNKWD